MTPSPRTVRTSDSIAEAARVMRDLGVGSIIVVDDNGRVTGIVTDRDVAIRRLPVVEGDRPVGIVSIGDLALERDPRSALADISSDQPNL